MIHGHYNGSADVGPSGYKRPDAFVARIDHIGGWSQLVFASTPEKATASALAALDAETCEEACFLAQLKFEDLI